VLTISTKTEFDVTILDFGFTPTFGVAGAWIALDLSLARKDFLFLLQRLQTTHSGNFC